MLKEIIEEILETSGGRNFWNVRVYFGFYLENKKRLTPKFILIKLQIFKDEGQNQ